MLKIVCMGDSLTYGYGLRRKEVWTNLVGEKYGIKVLNKGINGDSTGGMLSRFYQDVVENKPSHVIIMGGTNDFIMEVAMNTVRSNVAAMVHQSYGNRIIPILGIQTPAMVESINPEWAVLTDFSRVNQEIKKYREWVLEFSKIFHVPVIDFYEGFMQLAKDERVENLYTDGLHLTAKGNQLMCDMIKLEKYRI